MQMDMQTNRSFNRGKFHADSLLPNYKLGKIIGHGSSCKVRIAEHVLTGQKVAIKIFNRKKMKNTEMEEKVEREIKCMRLFMHPHIVRFYEVIETPTNIFLVMEYVKFGELFDYVAQKGRLQEDEACKFFQQIICGVEHCHRNMVVHRDLKPENLLLDSNYNVKIADFGFGNIMQDGHLLKTSCGSPNYAAPEIISGKLYVGPEVDVWSCGIILYALLCGTLPFDDENFSSLYSKIKSGIYTLPGHLSSGVSDLIQGIIVVDPMKRMTIPEIRQHPWFQVHLPFYIAIPPPNMMQQAKKIDDEILKEVVRKGFDRNEVVESLCNKIENEGTVTYYLLLDNGFHASNGYLGVEFLVKMEGGFNHTHPSGLDAPDVPRLLPGYMDYQQTGVQFLVEYNHTHPDEVNAPAVPCYLPGYMDYQQTGMQFPVERKWTLGLESQAHPLEIMTEVLKILQKFNVCWKKIGNYQIKCRWVPGILNCHDNIVNSHVQSNHSFGDEATCSRNNGVITSPNMVKFEVQLFKSKEYKNVLDLQRVQGPQLVFLDLCAAFLQQFNGSEIV